MLLIGYLKERNSENINNNKKKTDKFFNMLCFKGRDNIWMKITGRLRNYVNLPIIHSIGE